MSEFRGRVLGASLVTLSCALLASAAFAHAPLPGFGKTHHFGAFQKPYRAIPGHNRVTSGTWTEVAAFPGSSPETAELMANGTVIVHDACTSQWYRLTPDANGNYTTGTWSKIAAMPSGYAPLYFGSQVLNNGDMIMNGGEYNGSNCGADWTTLGAYYSAAKNKWFKVAAPNGWSHIGDAQSVLVNGGTYMLADCCDSSSALATIAKKGKKVSWTATGTNKTDDNDEEGYNLLSTGAVLSLNIWATPGKITGSELYSAGSWTPIANTTNVMADPSSFELGPALALPNNTVFQIGTDPCAATGCASHTSIYNVSTGSWSAGPDELALSGVYYSTEDAPAVVLPDGNVLSQQSPAYACGSAFCSPSHFFEYDGTAWTQVNDPVSGQASTDASYEGRFLPLPTGQVLWTSDQGDIEIYTPAGSANPAWAPTVTSVPTTLSSGQKNIMLQGTQLTGVADGGKYGDDAQMAENYPIIRITNVSGAVCFATSSGWTSTQTMFTMPGGKKGGTACPTGSATLQVVVNGIASTGVAVTVQ